jgi:hypothetical protein
MGMRATGEFWARKGYAFVCQDVRGRFGSEGSFDSPLGRHEITDGYDSIEWIINQDWSNGTVGMWGESYYGFTSYCGAISGHRALEAIAPGDPAPLTLHHIMYRQEAFPLNAMGTWGLAMDAPDYNSFDGLDYQQRHRRCRPRGGGQTGRLSLGHHPGIFRSLSHGSRQRLREASPGRNIRYGRQHLAQRSAMAPEARGRYRVLFAG